MIGLPERWLANLAVDSSQIASTRKRDWALAALLAVGAIFEVVFGALELPLAVLVVALIACAALPFRRQLPLEMAVTAFGAQFVLDAAARSGPELVTSAAQDLAGVALAYALCRWASPLRAAVGLATLSTLVVAGALIGGRTVSASLGELVIWLIIALAAIAMRYRGGLLAAQRDQVRLTERNLLARELHDTVAHHVSAIAVQAQAVQFIAQTDPDGALKAVAGIEEAANAAIDEMRHMVGILRSENDEARTVSPSSLEGLAGEPRIHLSGLSDLSGFPAPVASAVYRIAQESVTNAVRHGMGLTFVDVGLTVENAEVRLEVINDGSVSVRHTGTGYGLIGMKERIDALGGTIDVGPRAVSGWRVAATIPLHKPT